MFRRPTVPTNANLTVTSCTAGTATAAIPTGVGGGSDYEINIVSAVAFDIAFCSAPSGTITDPTDNSQYIAGIYTFRLSSRNTHFKLNAHATSKVSSWISVI